MHRKKPFSGKRKKQQLQEKRARHNEQNTTTVGKVPTTLKTTNQQQSSKAPQIQQQLPQKRGKKPNRLTTVFEKESQEEIDRRKKESTKPLRRGDEGQDSYYGELIDIPLRPYWDTSMTKEDVESNEERMFKNYLDVIDKKYPKERLNHFEHNLEVWRQLWRVCEISDILFILADCRHPLFHFPPSLYRYVVKSLKKPMALVLTKTDLVPEKVVNQWLNYFRKTFPGLMVTTVRSFEVDKSETISVDKKRKRRKRFAKQKPTGTRELIKFINGLVEERGYQPLEVPQADDAHEEDSYEDEEEQSSSEEEDDAVQKEPPTEDPNQESKWEDPNKSFITLGFIGHPNVGKSTLINTLKGKKVCSTSRTPGHTKYKQTVFLNDSIMLCDCPGLVFPASDVPKILQVVCGIYPIAQVREPYSAIRFIAERVPLETIYKLEKEENDPWSPYSLCEAYAEKRGYHTRKGRPDTHRAALEILRDHLDGRVVLYFTPNSTKINAAVYEDDLQPVDYTIIEEEEEKVEEKKAKGKKYKKQSSSEEESSNDEDEEDSESSENYATSNPFSVLV